MMVVKVSLDSAYIVFYEPKDKNPPYPRLSRVLLVVVLDI
jgi:hypothetical protein